MLKAMAKEHDKIVCAHHAVAKEAWHTVDFLEVRKPEGREAIVKTIDFLEVRKPEGREKIIREIDFLEVRNHEGREKILDFIDFLEVRKPEGREEIINIIDFLEVRKPEGRAHIIEQIDFLDIIPKPDLKTVISTDIDDHFDMAKFDQELNMLKGNSKLSNLALFFEKTN